MEKAPRGPGFPWTWHRGGAWLSIPDATLGPLPRKWYISQPGIDATTYDSGEGAVSAAPCCRCVPAAC